MKVCPECFGRKFTSIEEVRNDLEAPWCECPSIKVIPYKYSDDDRPDEIT